MDAEDDDLKALRSAALASLSSNVQKNEITQKKDEEDLEALRLAALMTRKQNHIQVIQPSAMPLILPVMPLPPTSYHPRHPWIANNLISLTPGPMIVRPINHPRPMRFVRSLPLRQPIRKQVLESVEIAVSEAKVPDKFSRYDTDSSSDEDDEHTTEKKKISEVDESDAESEASLRSFNSESDAGEGDTKMRKDVVATEDVPDNSEKSITNANDHNKSTNDDNISIIDNEEDDILAAIDDFLENRPEKDPQKTTTSVERRQPSQGTITHDIVPKSDVITKRKSSSKESNVGKTTIRSTTSRRSKHEQNVKCRANLKIHSQTQPSKKTILPIKTKEKRIVGAGEFKEKRRDIKTTSDMVTGFGKASQRPQNRTDSNTFPLSVKHDDKARRRSSDLDSVGTSDLSFISSDSDNDERVSRTPPRIISNSDKSVPEKPPSKYEPSRKASRDTESRRSNKNSSSRNIQGVSEAAQEGTTNDLRKKLESKGLMNRASTDVRRQMTDLPEKTEQSSETIQTARKMGVIKGKSSRCAADLETERRSKLRKDVPQILFSDLNKAEKIVVTRPNTIGTHGKRKIQLNRAIDRLESARGKSVLNVSSNSTEENTMLTKQTREQPNNKTFIQLETPKIEKKRKIKVHEERKQLKQTSMAFKKSINKKDDDFSVHIPSGSDADDVIFHEEEVFTFDKSDVPLYDDVLGNVNDGEDQQMTGGTKKSQLTIRSNKRDKWQPSNYLDRRRIVSKRSTQYSDKGGTGVKSKIFGKINAPGKKKGSFSSDVSGRPEMEIGKLAHTDDEMTVSIEVKSAGGELQATKLISDRELMRSSVTKKNEQPDGKRRKREIIVSDRRESQSGVSKIKRYAEASSKTRNVKARLGKINPGNALTRLSKKSRVITSESWVEVEKFQKTPVIGRNFQDVKQEDILEARIQRIKEQNGLIIKRQKEIQREKERFGF